MNLYNFNNDFIPLLQSLYKEKLDFNDKLENLHNILNDNNIPLDERDNLTSFKTIGINDRNNILIKLFHSYVDNNNDFNDKYITFINTYIRPLYPNENKLVIQKTPNIRISFPNLTAIGKYKNDEDNIIGLHSDSDFGHFSGEINIIIPITKMYDSNSIYYEPYVNSHVNYDKYNCIKLNENEYGLIYLNKLKHYNKINKTNYTRISLDTRVIPYSIYMNNIDFFKDTKFELGKYFIDI
jgi:hypothetical protein